MWHIWKSLFHEFLFRGLKTSQHPQWTIWGHAAANSRCPPTTTHTHTHTHSRCKEECYFKASTIPQRERFGQTEKRSAAGFQIKGHRCLLMPCLVILFYNFIFLLSALHFCFTLLNSVPSDTASVMNGALKIFLLGSKICLYGSLTSTKPVKCILIQQTSIKPKNWIYFKPISDFKHVKYIFSSKRNMRVKII